MHRVTIIRQLQDKLSNDSRLQFHLRSDNISSLLLLLYVVVICISRHLDEKTRRKRCDDVSASMLSNTIHDATCCHIRHRHLGSEQWSSLRVSSSTQSYDRMRPVAQTKQAHVFTRATQTFSQHSRRNDGWCAETSEAAGRLQANGLTCMRN